MSKRDIAFVKVQDFDLTYDLEIYCQSDGLLMQFILREFADTLISTRALIKVFKKAQKEPKPSSKQLEDLQDHLSKVGGHSFRQAASSPWSSSKGHLEKLVHYTYLLASRTESKKSKDLFHMMYHSISQTFHLCVQSQEYLSLTFRSKSGNLSKNETSQLFTSLEAFLEQMDRSSKLLDKLLLTCKDDENVLYMLLQQAPHFNKAFGRKFIDKITQKMYPGGLDELARLIQTKYKKRGFSQISKSLNQSIKALKPDGSP